MTGSTTGLSGFSGDGSAASSGLLNGPKGLTMDSSSNLYIVDAGNYRVRAVSDSTKVITTFAGD